jgi:glycosyltransferase involved in cell wall biosynthesis
MPKIEYACFVNNTGFGHAALGYVSCLQHAGISVRVKTLHPISDTSWMSTEDIDNIKKRFLGEADVSVWHAIPPRWGGLKKGNSRNVAVCTFECSSPPPDWISKINRDATHAMYPSEFCRQEFEESGVSIPGYVVPHLVRECFFSSNPRGYFGGTMNFLAVGAWKSRKNWHNLISGVVWAIQNGADVKLTIKTDRASLAKSDICRLVKKELQDRFMIADGNLSDRSMAGLYSSCDVFICASRGEGFCLPVAQAMAAGMPIVSTVSGGLGDLIDQSCAMIIPSSGIQPVSMDGYPQFSAKIWPIITVESIGRAVGEAFEKYHDLISGQARIAKARAELNFSHKVVCEKVKEAVGIL